MIFHRCRFSIASKFGRLSAICLYPCASLTLLLAQIMIIVDILYHTPTLIGIVMVVLTSICTIMLFCFFLKISCTCYQMENRQIALDHDGFTIRDRKDRSVPWREVYCIATLMYASSASKQSYQNVICIFLEKIDDRKLKRLRDSYLYGAFNQDRLILIDYDAKFVDALVRISGLSIVDFCSTQKKL